MRVYKGIHLSDAEHDDLDAYVAEIAEQRRKERENTAPQYGDDQVYVEEPVFDEDSSFDGDDGFDIV
jgi:hypothetical protein